MSTTLKKRPSVIVMKRLDTQELRLLSQAAGSGTRRAGVRLGVAGELLPHRRGEPILDAPAPPAVMREAMLPPMLPVTQLQVSAMPRRLLSVETPAIDAGGEISEEVRAFALAQLRMQSAPPARSAPPIHAKGLAGSLPALALEPSRRSASTGWAAGLTIAGVFLGVTIARVITSGAIDVGHGDAPRVAAAAAAEAPPTPAPAAMTAPPVAAPAMAPIASADAGVSASSPAPVNGR